MDFSEPIDLKLIREAVSKVCRDFSDEYWERQDREGQYPQEFYDAMAEAGWIGIAIPEAYGGAGKGVRFPTPLMSRSSATSLSI